MSQGHDHGHGGGCFYELGHAWWGLFMDPAMVATHSCGWRAVRNYVRLSLCLLLPVLLALHLHDSLRRSLGFDFVRDHRLFLLLDLGLFHLTTQSVA